MYRNKMSLVLDLKQNGSSVFSTSLYWGHCIPSIRLRRGPIETSKLELPAPSTFVNLLTELKSVPKHTIGVFLCYNAERSEVKNSYGIKHHDFMAQPMLHAT